MSNCGYLIGQISKLGARELTKLLQKYEIEEFNGPQGTILYALWQNECMSIKEISAFTGLAKTSLTTMLLRMEKRGLIVREDSTTDGRSTVIRLTPEAKALESKYNAVGNEMTDIYFKNFTAKEIDKLEEYLERILGNLR